MALFKDRDYKFFFTSKIFGLLRLTIIAIALYFLSDKIILIIDKVIAFGIYTAIIILLLIVFSIYQKKSNGNKIKDMSNHIEQLELKQDSKRSSSNLTKQGNTHPRDE